MAGLTQTFAKRVKPPSAGNHIHYDGEIKGFGLRVTTSGSKSFVLNYRFNGKERRYTIGPFPEFSLETARDEAFELRKSISNGLDPFVEKQTKLRDATESEARLRTMRDLATEYLDRHAKVHKRPQSIRDDKAMLDGVILPQLGRIRVASVSRRDVSGLHTSLQATPYRANRVLALLRKMFNFAISDNEREWGMAQNPASGVQKFHEEKRDRWLSEDELERLSLAMENYPDKRAQLAEVSEKQRAFVRSEALRAVNAIRLITVTGARKSEALCAMWPHLDLKRGVWTKPSHSTKQNRIEHVPLNDQAIAFLKSLPREGEYLFPGRMGAHLTDVKFPWAAICKDAELEGIRIHDLRHTYASHLVSRGVSLPIVGKLLGHTQAQTTARYAHLADNQVREAANLFPLVLAGNGVKLSNDRNSNRVRTYKEQSSHKGRGRKKLA
jgi:integrase